MEFEKQIPRSLLKKHKLHAYFPKNSKTDLTIERHRIKIPTLGWIRLKEYGYIPVNENVKSCTVSEKAGKYYVSVLFEEEASPVTYIKSEGIGPMTSDLILESKNLQLLVIIKVLETSTKAKESENLKENSNGSNVIYPVKS